MENSQTNGNNLSNKPLEFLIEELNEHKFLGIIVNKIANISSEKIKLRIIEIIKLLNSRNIDYLNLKKIIFEGLPDDIPTLRSLSWKMILNYLPLNLDNWEDFIDKKRNEYYEKKEKILTKLELDKLNYQKNKSIENKSKPLKDSIEILDSETSYNKNISRSIPINSKANSENSTNSENLLNPSEINKNLTSLKFSVEKSITIPSLNSNLSTKQKKIKKKNTFDHPLSNTNTSKWKNYFDDIELFEEIDKDVRRTRTHMNFFFMPAKSNKHLNIIKNEEISDHADKKRNDPGVFHDGKNKASFDTNADLMGRILFIYAKKYPEVRYVQGMNEILAPILYCFSNDQNPYFYLHLEADTYNCFENFMNEIQDIFIRSKDNTETGIQTRLKKLNLIIKACDKDLYNHLINEKVELQYFAFRWYTLFFTQEFEMPDILRLWDSLLSEDEKFDFLNMICIAIIKSKRQEILQNDFAGVMMTIQNFEKIEVENIIKYGLNLREEINKKEI